MLKMKLSVVCMALLAMICFVQFGRAEEKKAATKDDGLTWHNVQDWGVEGKGWTDTKRYFDRLPAKADGIVRKSVWGLSRDSAGMLVRFETDARTIWINYKLLSKSLGMTHMPATGASGLDLYARDGQGRWRWVAASWPNKQEIKARLVKNIDPGMRTYMLYLPLYNGVESLDIGVPCWSMFKRIPPRKQKPIIVYGTSIAQGGCASRPGMAWTNIVGRGLDRAVINLGFSGSGTMDPEMVDLLAELDAAVYVIDCLPNMGDANMVTKRTKMLVKKLRVARPDTPIVLVEDRTFTNSPFFKSKRDRNTDVRVAMKGVYDKLKASGVTGLCYVEGETLLGDDHEDTVDGSHLNDLGMLRQANVIMKVLQPLLPKEK